VSPSPLERVSHGEPDAPRACIDAYGALVWSLARRLSASPADAEDAVQEIFVDLWKNAKRFDPAIASDVTFVAMIARRRLIDRLRADGRRRDGRHADELSEHLVDPSGDRSELCAEAALAGRALAQLRPEQRDVLLLSTRQGMSHEEIATELGMPLGTVKAHARRGLARVRSILFGDGDDGGDP
jgi:RNA polymerase sigma-70 factor (ECF subfamily)